MLGTLFGERDPISLGHAGAGKTLTDWRVYDIASDKWLKDKLGPGESLQLVVGSTLM